MGSGSVAIIILIILLCGAGYLLYTNGVFDDVVKDPCEKEFEDCNYACGDGFLNSLCKSGCTKQYRECKEK